MQLREWREKRSLSMRELAQLAGVAHQTIYRLEHAGEKAKVHPRTRRKLAEALGVEPLELGGGPRPGSSEK